MNTQKANTVLILLLSVILAACSDRHDDFGRFAPLPSSGWAYGDTVTFDVRGLDSLPPLRARRLKVGVCHDHDYPYRNLILEVTWTDGQRIHRDTVNMALADKYGAWLGTGLGPSIQVEATVDTDTRIPDSSRVTVRHVMRVDTLRAIGKIGIIIDKP